MEKRYFSGAAIKTTTQFALSSTDIGMLNVVSDSGFPTDSDKPFVICLARGTVNEEKILVTSASENLFFIPTNGRGFDGTTARSHLAGTTVEHVIDAQSLQYIIDTANEMQILKWMDI